MAGGQRCNSCGKEAHALPDGRRMLCCSRCKSAHYCSQECQRSDWKSHKSDCLATKSAVNSSGGSSSSDASKAFGGALSEMEKPAWGGPILVQESLPERLQRILKSQMSGRSFGERFAKARELFRLGFCSYLEQYWESSMKALIE